MITHAGRGFGLEPALAAAAKTCAGGVFVVTDYGKAGTSHAGGRAARPTRCGGAPGRGFDRHLSEGSSTGLHLDEDVPWISPLVQEWVTRPIPREGCLGRHRAPKDFDGELTPALADSLWRASRSGAEA